jgi:hypothetical protein
MQSRAAPTAERPALRLATQVRSDVQDASDADVKEPDEQQDAFLRLDLDGGRRVEYSRRDSVVSRQESGNDMPIWREDFAFPAVSQLTIDEESAPQRLILTITAKLGEQPAARDTPVASPLAAPMSFQVEAVVGHHLRFRAARAAQEAPE